MILQTKIWKGICSRIFQMKISCKGICSGRGSFWDCMERFLEPRFLYGKVFVMGRFGYDLNSTNLQIPPPDITNMVISDV